MLVPDRHVRLSHRAPVQKNTAKGGKCHDQAVPCAVCRPDRARQCRPEGTPANERRYSNERLAEVFWTARDIARVMDETGYYALWTAEHHFQHEGYECLPNLIQLGLWLATQTERLKFGCGFNVLPMWHPLRLAEDYAMADIVTGGRVIMGVGRGYHTREVETLGGPLLDADEEPGDLRGRRATDAESLQRGVVSASRASISPARREVDYRGYKLTRHYPGAAAEPSAGGDLHADRQRHDDRYDGEIRPEADGGAERREDPRRCGPRLSRGCAQYGKQKQLGQDMVWGAGLYLARDQEEAIRKVEPAHDERYKWFAPFGFVRYADEHGRTWGTPGAPARSRRCAMGCSRRRGSAGRRSR